MMTRKMMLIAGVAGLALTTPAMAGPKGDRQQAQGGQQRGGGGARERAAPQRSEQPRMQRAERAPQRMEAPRMQRAERAQRMEASRMQRVERAERVRPQRVERVQRMEAPRIERQRVERPRIERQAVQRQTRVERPREVRLERRVEAQRDAANVFRPVRADGLDRNRSLPAASNFGQAVAARAHARNLARQEARRDWRLGERFAERWDNDYDYRPLRYASRYYDTPDYFYRYDGDNVYRVRRSDGLINSIFPILGGAYSIGQPLPAYYSSSYVPMGYRSLYYDTPDYYYRYGDGGLYEVNSQSGLITALVALLSGNNLGIGSMMPADYSVYNVPYAYRDRYYDTNDAWYRYDDGYIYQVDPYSRRIEASYPIYNGGYYGVGSAWPTAYPNYNVPYAYQSMYADTPQWDYRYANGGIYRVDPKTQVISALVSLVTGQQMQVGQPMPAGYSAYNLPLSYRDRYYDTADNYYRYSDGYIYRVDPYTGRIGEVIPAYA